MAKSSTSSAPLAKSLPTVAAASPNEIKALEEQRDLLLDAIDSLDAELESGDLDQADYDQLRDGYVARAAEVLKRLDGHEDSPVTAGSGHRRWIVGGIVLVFSVFAGFALASAIGERGVNGQITGGIDASEADPASPPRLVECQELGSTGGDLVGSLECFDEVLADEPNNAEALAYRGWYVILAAGSLQSASDPDLDPEQLSAQADELIASGLSFLDKAVEADPELLDARAFRATVYDRLGQSAEACSDVEALLALNPPEFFVNQTAQIAERNGCNS